MLRVVTQRGPGYISSRVEGEVGAETIIPAGARVPVNGSYIVHTCFLPFCPGVADKEKVRTAAPIAAADTAYLGPEPRLPPSIQANLDLDTGAPARACNRHELEISSSLHPPSLVSGRTGDDLKPPTLPQGSPFSSPTIKQAFPRPDRHDRVHQRCRCGLIGFRVLPSSFPHRAACDLSRRTYIHTYCASSLGLQRGGGGRPRGSPTRARARGAT